MYLIGDIGNTAIKICLFNNNLILFNDKSISFIEKIKFVFTGKSLSGFPIKFWSSTL